MTAVPTSTDVNLAVNDCPDDDSALKPARLCDVKLSVTPDTKLGGTLAKLKAHPIDTTVKSGHMSPGLSESYVGEAATSKTAATCEAAATATAAAKAPNTASTNTTSSGGTKTNSTAAVCIAATKLKKQKGAANGEASVHPLQTPTAFTAAPTPAASLPSPSKRGNHSCGAKMLTSTACNATGGAAAMPVPRLNEMPPGSEIERMRVHVPVENKRLCQAVQLSVSALILALGDGGSGGGK